MRSLLIRLLFPSVLVALSLTLAVAPVHAQDAPSVPGNPHNDAPFPTAIPEQKPQPEEAVSGASSSSPTLAPINDDFDFAIVFLAQNAGVFTSEIDIGAATAASDDPARNCGSTTNSNSVWFRVTPTEPGILELDTSGSTYDTVLTVYTGSRGSLSVVACDDDSGTGTTSKMSISVMRGVTYHILVTKYGSPGIGSLRFVASYTPLESIDVPLDIILVQDETGSMRDDIAQLQQLAPQIWDSIAVLATVEFRIGVVGFRDFARTPWGESTDWVYRLVVAPTNSRQEFVSGVYGLSASGGADGPESQFPALFYLLTPNQACIDSNGDGDCVDAMDTPAGQQPRFRSGAERIVLLATDNTAHTPESADLYPGPRQAEMIDKLLAADVTVIGLVPGGPDVVPVVDLLANATGGSVQDTGATGSAVARAIIDAIQQLRPVSAELSTVEGPTGVLRVDPSVRVPITVTLLDTIGRPVAGHQVYLSTDRPGLDVIEQPSGPTDDSGTAIGYIQSMSAGVVSITASDLNEGIVVSQRGQVVYVEDVIAPSGSLANAVEVQRNMTNRILQRLGKTTSNVAANGDYFKSQVHPDRARFWLGMIFNAANAAQPIQSMYRPYVISKLGTITAEGVEAYSHILLIKVQGEVAGRLFDLTYSESTTVVTHYVVRELAKNGWRYWAAEVLDEAVEDVTEDMLQEGVAQMVTRSDQSMTQAASVFSSRIEVLSSRLSSLSNDVLTGIPEISAEKQEAHANDLHLRTEAALAYEEVYSHQAMLLQNLRMAHDSDSGFVAGTIGFIARIGGKVLTTVMFGPVAGIAFEAPINYIESRQEYKAMKTAERAYAIAPALMANAAERANIIYDSAGGGLKRITNNLPVRTGTGVIESVRHFEEAKNWLSFWETKRAYSEVTIRNTTNEPVIFTVLTKYSFQDTLFALPYALVTLAQEDSKWLQAGETGTIRIDYLDEEFGYPPDKNSDITFIVIAANPSGKFKVGHVFTEWNPQRVGAVAAAGAADDNLPSLVTPLSTYLYQYASDDVYTAEMWLSNPFTGTYNATIVQPLPRDLTVLGTDGMVTADSIEWHLEVSARDVISTAFVFRYSAPYGEVVDLPPAQLQFVEPASKQLIVTGANAPSFQVPLPLSALLSVPEGQFGRSDAIGVLVQNSSSTPQYPQVRLVLRDFDGRVVFEAAETTGLEAGMQRILKFLTPDKLGPSWYDVEVWGRIDSDEVLLATGVFKVGGNALFLPSVRR